VPVPPITFPEALPVSARREEIAAALREHAVVIVSGETGSGKTTQLPKIALSIGRGRGAGGTGLIGHTQPRRIAAQSVAARIAAELGTPPGEVVGHQVRFQDRTGPGASVKLMTDGILLAETQGDPLLRAYDTLIVDEAHERSLNIDFLLGHLKQVLPRRPDLKVIVTSATIDAQRFAAHFAGARGPAPVIEVSGRTFPVEQRWRPFEESRAYGVQDAIADAVDELWPGGAAEGRGDILVFLPGEREIRDTADHLRRHLEHARRGGAPAEVLPLFARLSAPEQQRVFAPSNGRRIVLATNVAETSLTVPGIRFVIDPGTARVKRYSYRNKVEQLLLEPVSQASANQRAGRCGRVAAGVCIRLYDEASFAARPRFTDPEILRSSLAGVILRMTSLGLGQVEDFPFLEAPPKKAIADGYELLGELGAVDEARGLTPVGRALARLPLDPRVGRMILEAKERDALAEVLVIAAALSSADVRDRPLEAAAAADQKHRLFDDAKSEFAGTLKLWQWIEAGRGTHGHAGAEAVAAHTDTHRLSNRQQEQRLREHFISPRKVREWRDVHSQLLTVATEQGWRLATTPATGEQLHCSLLAGLLGNIGVQSDEDESYLGARGIRFWRHPGVHLASKKSPGRWIVAAELVETSRLYARGLAAIDPRWVERIGAHLLKRQRSDPQWDEATGEAYVHERGTVYGLPVYHGRRVALAPIDPAAAREVFLREGLVAERWPEGLERRVPALAHNARQVRAVRELEHKARRQDVLVDDAFVEAFYAAVLPAEVNSAASLERFWRAASPEQRRALELTREDLMRHEAAGVTSEAFPRTVKLAGVDCSAEYLHEPGHPRDGVTVTVPLFVLNQVNEERCDWLVPGLLKEKVLALLKTLPQRARSRLVPLPAAADAIVEGLAFAQGSLADALLEAVRARTELPVPRSDFKPDQLPAHLRMNLRVTDEHGRQLGIGRDVAGLKADLGGEARSAFQALAAVKRSIDAARAAAPAAAPAPAARAAAVPSSAAAGEAPPERHTAWTFGPLPELLELRRGGVAVIGFPAIVDGRDHVRLDVFDEPEVAARTHRAGLARLFTLQLREPLKALDRQLPDAPRLAAAFMAQGVAWDEARAEVVGLAVERAFLAEPLPADAASFDARLAQGRGRLVLIAQEVARLAGTILAAHAAAQRKWRDQRAALPKDMADDIEAQLKRLVNGPRWLREHRFEALSHVPRYLEAIVLRLEKWRADPARDAARLAELRPLEARWARRTAELKGARHPALEDFRWLLEELRVSLFAQELRTPTPVSVKRLEKAWAAIER
jgi:ATP-dependent helicase HrpA